MPRTPRELALYLRAVYTRMALVHDAAILEGVILPDGDKAAYIEGMRDMTELAEALAGLRDFPDEVEVPPSFYE